MQSWIGTDAELDQLREFGAAFADCPLPGIEALRGDLHTEDVVEYLTTGMDQPMHFDVEHWVDVKMAALHTLVGQMMFDPTVRMSVHGDQVEGSITIWGDGQPTVYKWKTVHVPVGDLAGIPVQEREGAKNAA